MARRQALYGQRHVIPADMSAQKPSNSYVPITQYENKRVPCSGCRKPILWTAEQQRTWYEEIKANTHAPPNLRCDSCRKRGQHDNHRRRHRDKVRRNSFS